MTSSSNKLPVESTPNTTLTEEHQGTPRKRPSISPILLSGLIMLCLSPCFCCGAARVVPYLAAEALWSSHGSSDYNITLAQGGYANLNPYLMPNVNTVLEVRNGQVVAVFIDGKPFDTIAPIKYWDLTVDGLFAKASGVLFSPFVTVSYNSFYGYLESIIGGFIEGGGLSVEDIQLGTATPSFSPLSHHTTLIRTTTTVLST